MFSINSLPGLIKSYKNNGAFICGSSSSYQPIFVAPTWEETVFRGSIPYIQNALEKFTGKNLALLLASILTSLVFAIDHIEYFDEAKRNIYIDYMFLS